MLSCEDAPIEFKKAHDCSSHNRQHIDPVEEEVLRVRNGFIEQELPRVVWPVRAALEILLEVIVRPSTEDSADLRRKHALQQQWLWEPPEDSNNGSGGKRGETKLIVGLN